MYFAIYGNQWFRFYKGTNEKVVDAFRRALKDKLNQLSLFTTDDFDTFLILPTRKRNVFEVNGNLVKVENSYGYDRPSIYGDRWR